MDTLFQEETRRTSSPWEGSGMNTPALAAEVDDSGNVEYKLNLVNCSPERVEHLVTQLQWRLAEGNGEALYELGVGDDGEVIGMTTEERQATLATLTTMASQIPADISIEREVTLPTGRVALECLVRRRMIEEDAFLEITVAMVGGQDGKSTLLAQLTRGAVDNGRGSGRFSIARHQHERVTGVTSSITHEILGYTSAGKLVRSSDAEPLSWEEITQMSSKIIHFLDTCGTPKYLKTTIRGLTGNGVDYACLCISAGKGGGVTQTTLDHLELLLQWNIPFFICVTKKDLAKVPRIFKFVKLLENWIASEPINGEAKIIYENDRQGIISASQTFSRYISSSDKQHKRVVPVFFTSCIDPVDGIDELHLFLNLLPKPPNTNMTERTVLGIEDVFWKDRMDRTSGKTEVIIWGVLRGQKALNLDMWRSWLLGPDQEGEFRQVKITSLHRQRVPSATLLPGQAGSLIVESVNESEPFLRFQVQKGMVLIEDDGQPVKASFGFTAEVFIMAHRSALKAGKHEYMAHSTTMRAVVRVDSVIPAHDVNLNADEPEEEKVDELPRKTRGLVHFRFLKGPEWVTMEERVLITDASGSRIVGQVVKVDDWDSLPETYENGEMEKTTEKLAELKM
jgi:GTPase